ncbi:hypothetical protein SDRG_08909 [Saprolegnia diclina VS20]|uniref:Uncharacterized protein n=1 Tax=Saprolegnia diclina (strain VS20) TaxID=1156394 RepID=T0RT12_SAPDV|nr:hypothetical protein SDRG_08909 [Saprolegnia diclina VS20]EQC33392.1 hypothetical protein SDRG_08909 [Saprolegnia diclina VS20]|eukprot:XP_008613032.1 hypothetical protein SDRG_08909 [Saprolegnia diclina VS20]
MDRVIALCTSVWREVQEDGLEAFLFPRAAYCAVPQCESDVPLRVDRASHRVTYDATDDAFGLPEDYDEIATDSKRQRYCDPAPRFDAKDGSTISLLSASRA